MTRKPGAGGRTVLLTRPEEDSRRLRGSLEELGARVLSVPSIRFEPSEDLREWRTALERRSSITHLVFTSRRAAEHFLELAAAAKLPLESWRGCRVAAVGERTAAALEARGVRVDVRPERSSGAGLAAELVEREGVGPGSVVLLPQSEIARPETAELIRAAGATVLAVPVYATAPEDPALARPFLEALDRGETIDAAVFASPSALAGFLDMTGRRGRAALESRATRIVSIGPTTSRALRDAGLTVAAEARSPSPEALLEAVLEVLGRS